MVVLDDFAGGIELPEVIVVGKRIVLPAIGRLEGDKYEDLVASTKERARFEARDFQRCERLEEADAMFDLPRRA